MSVHKITEKQAQLMKLIARSADIGEGWRQVPDPIWNAVKHFARSDLMEIDEPSKRIRLTDDGRVVLKYIR